MAQIGFDDGRVVPHGLRPPFGDFRAVVEHVDPIGELHHEFELVFNQQDRDAPRLERRDERLHLPGFGRIHAGGRLVEQQHSRLQREGASDLQAAAIGVREAVGGMIKPRDEPVAKKAQDLARFGFERLFLAPHRLGTNERQRELSERADERPPRPHCTKPGVGAEKHIVLDAEIGEHPAMLKGARETARGDRFRREPLKRLGREQDFAFIRPVEAADHVERRRFAGAIGANETDELAFADDEVERLDGGHPAETARQSANFHQRRHA
jgi:hypothetical protein